jgi:hypothetical protein
MKLDTGNWQVFWLNPNLTAFPLIKQWHKYQVIFLEFTRGFTATGIAPDFHRLPFSSRFMITGNQLRGQM